MFTGSLLSAIGSGLILLCYFALPLKKHFRHVLIINLAVADFVNSVNNSASGAQILIHRTDLKSGPGCVLNGFMGQITVQATDTAIFAIAVVTVITITGTSRSRLVSGEWEWPQIVGATVAIWLLPVLTSFIALGKKWCWLINEPVYLRYVLTHGWRYLFMLLEVILYTYLHFYLRRHFRKLAVPLVSNIPSSGDTHTTHDSHATGETSRTGITAQSNKSSRMGAQSPPLEPITFSRNPEELATRLSHSDETHPSVTSPSAGDGRRYGRRRGNSIYVDPPQEEDEVKVKGSPGRRVSILATPVEEEPSTLAIEQPPQSTEQIQPSSSLSNEVNDGMSISTHAHSGKRESTYVIDVEKAETNVEVLDAPPVYALSSATEDTLHTHPPSKPTFSVKRLLFRTQQRTSENPHLHQNHRQRAIQRILLLNAYPLLYIILWIPGLAHRLVEASGHTSRVTQTLQASTQFVGLANAITYGWNERIWLQLKERWQRRRESRRI
ncbi:hypothetical protein ONZ45_g16506 [Pleurotus djamor]|nr:hypothetical protein ONZ45_g16506 [Pleurotus djamor]